MKISKDTYLVVLTAEQAKAMKLFLGPISVGNARDIVKQYNGDTNQFNKIVDNYANDPLFATFQQVKNA